MKLKELLADMPVTTVKSGGPLLEQEIEGVTKDSREVREGYVFFATGASKPYLSSALGTKASGRRIGRAAARQHSLPGRHRQRAPASCPDGRQVLRLPLQGSCP